MTVGELSTIWSQHPDLMYIKEVEGRPDTSHREVNSKRDRQTDPHLSHIFFTMATRSRIGIELQDGSILSSYHHWDGYPSWLGRILETHYNTKEKVSSLIDGGDMSSCWSDTVWGKIAPMVKSTVPSITLLVVRIALLVMIRTWKSSFLWVKNTLTSSAMVTGLPTTCTSLMLM